MTREGEAEKEYECGTRELTERPWQREIPMKRESERQEKKEKESRGEIDLLNRETKMCRRFRKEGE